MDASKVHGLFVKACTIMFYQKYFIAGLRGYDPSTLCMKNMKFHSEIKQISGKSMNF